MRALDIGCGDDKLTLQGWEVDGIDRRRDTAASVVCDIERPWPLRDNTYDRIYARQVLEHVRDLEHVLREIIRVGRNRGTVHIVVPHFTNNGFYRDPTHVRSFAYRTFDHFTDLHGQVKSIMTRPLNNYSGIYFRIRRRRLVAHPPLTFTSPLVNVFPNFYERYLSFVFTLNRICFELEIVK